MTNFQKVCLVGFLMVAVVVTGISTFAAEDKKETTAKAAAPATELILHEWSQRCVEEKVEGKSGKKAAKKSCAIFERIDMKDSKLRLAEFAVGFAGDKEKEKGTALGKITLPLGIMIDPGISMKIDDGKPYIFRPAFCTNEGCITFVNLDKDVLTSMKKGKNLIFGFKTAEGRDANLTMTLTGFEKAFKTLE